MRASIIASLLLGCVLCGPAFAQPAGGLDETQTLGRQLLNQHCAICHLRPQLGAPTFGPMLNKESLGGNDSVLREVIGTGTPRMPGFKLQFKAEQLDAIIAYLKTVPVQAQPAPAR